MALTDHERRSLTDLAKELRKVVINMTTKGGAGHVGPSLSCADIMACLYGKVMKIDPSNPAWEDRDRFILSAGHKSAVLYSILALRGFYPMETLDTYLQDNSLLGAHPVKELPGVDLSTGSLGHGLGIGVGISLAAKYQKKSYKTYVLLGDGELAEGSNWEAAMAASHFGLTNLVAIVDRNTLQIGGRTEEVMSLEPLADKWKAFGWGVREVYGHDLDELDSAFSMAPVVADKPTVILARTVKGKGVSFIEDRLEWHYKAATPEQAVQAIRELDSEQGVK